MKRLLILSGKGGTGKTTVAGAFIKLSNAKAFADCDVDAPNLHLIMEQKAKPLKSDYYGMGKAKIATEKCTSCGLCENNCRFKAISFDNGCYIVDTFSCEGCGVCEAICPNSAISLFLFVAGERMLYKSDVIFSTAQLKMGSGTSGKLVTEVKKQLNLADEVIELAIIDGSPGIGCPVIASLSGVDMVLIVAEPSLSGISDMKRIIKTAQKFGVKTIVCVNKYDTNIENTIKIEKLCYELGLPYAGKIPFDSNVITALNKGKSITDIDCAATKAIKSIYEITINILKEQ
jgi:MinD superfamily P-loop ATPase